MAFVKPDPDLLRPKRAPKVEDSEDSQVMRDTVVDVLPDDPAYAHHCVTCGVDQYKECQAVGAGVLIGHVHKGRHELGAHLSEPQSPPHTLLRWTHHPATDSVTCPVKGCGATPGVLCGPQLGTHLGRVQLWRMDGTGPLCCWDVGGGGVCHHPAKPVKSTVPGVAFCAQHWIKGRNRLAVRGQIICEALGCRGTATVLAITGLKKEHRLWCEMHAPIPGGPVSELLRLENGKWNR